MKVCPTCQRSYPTTFAVCPQDGARLSDSQEWSAGAVIRGKYRILAKIGEGGMGAVYKATHMHFDEPCALKVMSSQLANDTALVKRFGREAVIARKLRHKNAVRVEDFDEAEDGRPFIVMEYIEGQSLKHLMSAAGPLPPARVSSIIKQAAAALDAAHRLGLVHRDIKPDNIVLITTKDGDLAKVLDFGIAKVRDAQGGGAAMTLTETGMVIGTPPYMSPEQARGAHAEELDGRSDIYSLGVVMYQMLTGVLPLKADTPMDMLFAQIQTPPTPIFQARPGVRIPEPLGHLAMKCLAKERDQRPGSGAELIEELERWEASQAEAPGMGDSLVFSSEGTTISDTPARLSARTAGTGGKTSSKAPQGRAPMSSATREESTEGDNPGAAFAKSSAAQNLEPPSQQDASQPGSSGKSRTALFAAIAVAFLVVVVAAVWFLGHRVSPSHPASDVEHAVGPDVAKPAASQPDAQPAKQDQPTAESNRAASAPVNTHEQPKPAVPELSPAEKAARARKVASTTALGDLYLDNHQFDNAIKEYQLGLDADPSNTALQERLARARKAKESAKP